MINNKPANFSSILFLIRSLPAEFIFALTKRLPLKSTSSQSTFLTLSSALICMISAGVMQGISVLQHYLK
jgi:hypothetical protein